MSGNKPLPPTIPYQKTTPHAHLVEIEGDNGPEMVPVEVAQVEALFRIADALEALVAFMGSARVEPVTEPKA